MFSGKAVSRCIMCKQVCYYYLHIFAALKTVFDPGLALWVTGKLLPP